MKQFEFRWKNFRCFEDTGWREIKPLTIFIGPNNSGKTSLILPFLLMKQSIGSIDLETPLKIKGDYVDLGGYRQIVNNNDISKKIEFSFRLMDKHPQHNGKNNESNPKQLNLIFKKGTKKKRIRLDEYIIKNKREEDLLIIKLIKNHYQLKYYKYSADLHGIELESISNPIPNNFLFLVEPFYRQIFDDKIMKKSLLEHINKFFSIMNISNDIQDILERTDFIGPLREDPERLNYLSGDKPRSVGITGKFTPEVLWLTKNTNFEKLVKKKFKEHLGINFKIEPMGSKASWAFRLLIKDQNSKLWVDLADGGFGYSQLIPLIVQGLYTQKGELFITEQPEIHLNPKIQSQLGDFFVYLANIEKKFVIVETHSEHLLLRIRTLIAEEKIDCSHVALYFVEREEGISKVKQIPINEYGHIDDEDWPEEFLDDTIVESFRLSSAQREKHRRNLGVLNEDSNCQ